MANARILVVEDEGITFLEIKMHLTNQGHTVVGHASSGEEAIKLAEETSPDLILMDIKLKGPFDGIDTANLIHAKQDIPIVYLTAFADETTLQRAKVSGTSGYVLKPFHERDLDVAIEIALYKHSMEKALRESEERYMVAIQGANDGIWDWDLTQNQVYYSPRWKEIIGYQDDEIGTSLEDWLSKVHEEDRSRLELAFNHHIDGISDRMECETRMLHKDGSIRWVLVRGLAIIGDSHLPRRMAGSISDITALKNAQEQLIYDSYHDSLTGIPNRALFIDRLEQAINRRQRYRQGTLAVLFLDLDSFKNTNDSLGHLVGDKLLAEVAGRLQKLVRASDTVARLGGDEFVILLENVKGVGYLSNVAERIAEVLRVPIVLEGRTIITTASIGIVAVSDDHKKVTDVLRDADIAMYRAKALGKNRYEVFDEQYSHHSSRRLLIENLLLSALEKETFQLYYQPIFTLPERQLVGVEALLRLFPDNQPPIPPSEFIPIAEEIGIISQIGDWVLLESGNKVNKWHKRFPNPPKLNLHVNISLKQLSEPNFTSRVQEILDITKLDPATLYFEITEKVFNVYNNNIGSILDQINMLGISLLIDNFGTGYSSLGYIKRFPIGTIKLDRSFVFPEDDGQNAEIIEAVLALADQLGLKTVVSGIETEEQVGFLEMMKCHFGQGFLFSEPMEIQSLEKVLGEKS